jgi:hypothetical protein
MIRNENVMYETFAETVCVPMFAMAKEHQGTSYSSLTVHAVMQADMRMLHDASDHTGAQRRLQKHTYLRNRNL